MQQAMRFVLEIFKKWAIVFGNKYKLENLDPEALQLWAIALYDLKATPEDIALATRVSLTQKWPPSTPADFIELAHNLDPEYPSVDTAFRVACSNSGAVNHPNLNWLHDVVRVAAMRYGMFDLARADDSALPRFKQIYNEVVAEHRAGADFRVPESRRIEPPPVKTTPATPEQVDAYMDKIRAMLREAR